MTCIEAQELIDAYIDGELELTAALALETHTATCVSCAAALASRREIAAAVRRYAESYPAPAALRERLTRTDRSSTDVSRPSANRALPTDEGRATRARSLWPWLALAATVVVIVGLVGLGRRSVVEGASVQDQIVAAHLRSQLAAHLTDVASSDRHTVKPWLSSHLDFSASVPDLADQGFPLVGGRLDYIERAPVAALVYKRREHVINVFVWPDSSADQAPIRTLDSRGYHLVHWTKGGMTYWVVSDLEASELADFAGGLAGR